MRNAVLSFIFGAVAYVSIELAFRGRSHISMAFAGGICMLILYTLFPLHAFSLFEKCLLSALVITSVEFLFGVVVNITLQLNVWDYSDRAFNLFGQICPIYSLAWFFMGIPISIAVDFIKNI